MNIYQRDAIEEPSSILDNISLSTHYDKEFTQPPFSIHNEYYFSDDEIDDAIQSNQSTSLRTTQNNRKGNIICCIVCNKERTLSILKPT